jgi:hypothetical protein
MLCGLGGEMGEEIETAGFTRDDFVRFADRLAEETKFAQSLFVTDGFSRSGHMLDTRVLAIATNGFGKPPLNNEVAVPFEPAPPLRRILKFVPAASGPKGLAPPSPAISSQFPLVHWHATALAFAVSGHQLVHIAPISLESLALPTGAGLPRTNSSLNDIQKPSLTFVNSEIC